MIRRGLLLGLFLTGLFGGGAAAADPVLHESFFAFDADFRGGVAVAFCGLDAMQSEWFVVATGPGGGTVSLFVAPSAPFAGVFPMASWAPYGDAWRGGVHVSCSVQPYADGSLSQITVITGAGGGGGPHVMIWRLLA